MRPVIVLFAMAGAMFAQSLTEVGAAAAGSVTGGVAGKKVSDGITRIFGKVDRQTQSAADDSSAKKTSAKTAAAKSAPERASLHEPAEPTPSSIKILHSSGHRAAVSPDPSNVPPPPPVRRASVVRKPVERPAVISAPAAPPPPPPAPPVTLAELKSISPGASRAQVLALGTPASRVSMDDEGKLFEIYLYTAGDSTLGEVRLTDGAVSSVALR